MIIKETRGSGVLSLFGFVRKGFTWIYYLGKLLVKIECLTFLK